MTAPSRTRQLPEALCQWASCTERAVTVEGGYAHCASHLREHRAFIREEIDQELRARRQNRRGQGVSLRAAITRLNRLGYTDREIGTQLLVTPACIKGERQKLGLPPNELHLPAEPLPCGTHAAFNRHRLRQEEPCPECVLAERVYQRLRGRERRARQRQQRASA